MKKDQIPDEIDAFEGFSFREAGIITAALLAMGDILEYSCVQSDTKEMILSTFKLDETLGVMQKFDKMYRDLKKKGKI